MNRFTSILIIYTATAQMAAAQGVGHHAPRHFVPSAMMSFFVTSEPIGDGGNLGGLEGADAHCQRLATNAGAGHRTWRAYLSTQARPGKPAVNARDRIGDGPWFHPRGTGNRPMIKSEIHGDTLIEAQRGANLFKAFALTEKGDEINGVGDPMPNLHDMLTGSTPDGRAFEGPDDRTCNNWTSNDEGAAQVGHSDRIGHGNQSWNSSHATTGCSQADFASWNGAGLFYCFAID